MTDIRISPAFLLGPILLGCGLALPAQAQHSRSDIVDTAVAAGSFKTLAKALQAADLVEVLKGKGPFTVFAPTDAAFARLPKGTLQSLLRKQNKARLQQILTYHVLPGSVSAKQVLMRGAASTVSGQRVQIRASDAGVRIDDAGLVKTDIRCSNGIIHVIDAVLIPSADDIAATAKKAGKFKTLLAAAKAAGLVDELMGDKPLTVFAPTDAAFGQLPKGAIARLLEPANRAELRRVLRFHVVPGRVYAEQALSKGRADSLQKGRLHFSLRDGQLRVEKAKVVANDIQAKNGVIHVIDRVLMPPVPDSRKLVGITIDKPGAALAAQLQVDRNQTLLVSAVSDNAQQAGLRRYDLITLIDGRPATRKNLDRSKSARRVGESIQFQLRRAGRSVKIAVPVGLRH